MRKILIAAIVIITCSYLAGIDLNLTRSAVHNATSGLSFIFETPTASASNPALCFQGIETSATYLFGLKDLPFYNFHSAKKFKNIGFYLGDSFLDHDLNLENSLNMGFSYHLDHISSGINLRYLTNDVEGYSNNSVVLFDGGFAWQISNFKTGISLRNIAQSAFLDEKLPTVLLFETCFDVTPKSRLSLGVEKEDEFDFSFKLAARYDILKQMILLTSYQYEPDRIGIGAVFNVANINITYSVRTHQYLSLTHYISLGYKFGKK